ncbi:MAG: hypothetical protein K0U47_02125 [Epsilonproteobacteria bacterium]|nr:hypothetical protein [Campylobacterota bacterium]
MNRLYAFLSVIMFLLLSGCSSDQNSQEQSQKYVKEVNTSSSSISGSSPTLGEFHNYSGFNYTMIFTQEVLNDIQEKFEAYDTVESNLIAEQLDILDINFSKEHLFAYELYTGSGCQTYHTVSYDESEKIVTLTRKERSDGNGSVICTDAFTTYFYLFNVSYDVKKITLYNGLNHLITISAIVDSNHSDE